MTFSPLARLNLFLSCIAFGFLASANCFADESPSVVFLDSTKSIEDRLAAMKSIKHRDLKATPEQMIAILGDVKLPDDMRCFTAEEFHFGPVTITAENQTQIDKIATSIVQNNQDGGEDLKLSILRWIYTRGTFNVQKGLPTVPSAALKNLLASENAEIRQKAIRFIREDDSTFVEELENALRDKPLGKVTTFEALESLARHSIQHAPFNKEALIPLLKNESLEISTLAALQLARSDERDYYHDKLSPLLTDAETPPAMKIATMKAMTSSLMPNNNDLYHYTVSLNQIVHDKNTSPELKQNALINLCHLIESHPPDTIHREITESLYNLHLSYLKSDPEGILFEAVDRENIPKWAEYIEPIYTHLVRNHPEFKEKREARRLVAEQNKLKKEISILHDKLQTPAVRHQMFFSVGTPEEVARFAMDRENDEKLPALRIRAIESLFSKVAEKQEGLNTDLVRLAKVVKHVSEEKIDSRAKSRAIQFKEIIRKEYPVMFAKFFPKDTN